MGFIRSLARYFYETAIRAQTNQNSSSKGNNDDDEAFFTTRHTIDDLYELVYPQYDRLEIQLYSLPLKFIVDTMMTHNVRVDFDSHTKKLSAAHFDSEAFANGSRRIVKLRRISDVPSENVDKRDIIMHISSCQRCDELEQ
jgi:hypothetical protein